MSSSVSRPLRLDFILNASRPASPVASERHDPYLHDASRSLGPLRPATHHEVMTGSPRVSEWSLPRRHSDYPRPSSHQVRHAPYPMPLMPSQSQVIDDHAYTSVHPAVLEGNPGGRESISRATKACEACRISKVRCTHGPGTEPCKRCAESGRKCIWSTQRKRGPAPGTLGANRQGTTAVADRGTRRSRALGSASRSVYTPSPRSIEVALAPLPESDFEQQRAPANVITPPTTATGSGLASHRDSVESAASIRLVTPEHVQQGRAPSNGDISRDLPLPRHDAGTSRRQERRVSYQDRQAWDDRAEPARMYFAPDYTVRHSKPEKAGPTLPPISALLGERQPPSPSPYRHSPAPASQSYEPASPRRPRPVIPTSTSRRDSLFGSDGRSMPPSAGRRSFWNAGNGAQQPAIPAPRSWSSSYA